MESSALDPSLPGVRILQSWIREKLQLSLELNDGRRFDGILRWQDSEFFALERSDSNHPTLINRRAVAVIRQLG